MVYIYRNVGCMNNILINWDDETLGLAWLGVVWLGLAWRGLIIINIINDMNNSTTCLLGLIMCVMETRRTALING